MYNIISITSYSGVGKTTLIEGVIKELSLRGYKVGTIKHTCHDFDIDKEGKDTFRHRQAGASKVCVISKNRFSYIEELKKEKSLKEAIRLYSDMDLIIIEGYKKYKFKKIEVIRKDKYINLISDIEDIIGVASDSSCKLNKMKFNLNDYKKIADYLELCINNNTITLTEKELDNILNIEVTSK